MLPPPHPTRSSKLPGAIVFVFLVAAPTRGGETLLKWKTGKILAKIHPVSKAVDLAIHPPEVGSFDRDQHRLRSNSPSKPQNVIESNEFSSFGSLRSSWLVCTAVYI